MQGDTTMSWPLICDPTSRALEWVRTYMKGKGLVEVRYSVSVVSFISSCIGQQRHYHVYEHSRYYPEFTKSFFRCLRWQHWSYFVSLRCSLNTDICDSAEWCSCLKLLQKLLFKTILCNWTILPTHTRVTFYCVLKVISMRFFIYENCCAFAGAEITVWQLFGRWSATTDHRYRCERV